MDNQISISDEVKFWIPEIDNNCRMWKCPDCSRRMVGQPLHWYQFNPYDYCPFCGVRLYTERKYLSDLE